MAQPQDRCQIAILQRRHDAESVPCRQSQKSHHKQDFRQQRQPICACQNRHDRPRQDRRINDPGNNQYGHNTLRNPAKPVSDIGKTGDGIRITGSAAHLAQRQQRAQPEGDPGKMQRQQHAGDGAKRCRVPDHRQRQQHRRRGDNPRRLLAACRDPADDGDHRESDPGNHARQAKRRFHHQPQKHRIARAGDITTKASRRHRKARRDKHESGPGGDADQAADMALGCLGHAVAEQNLEDQPPGGQKHRQIQTEFGQRSQKIPDFEHRPGHCDAMVKAKRPLITCPSSLIARQLAM